MDAAQTACHVAWSVHHFTLNRIAEMLTRLRVNGFKNLRGVDIKFGPFTCIAGPNGVGKSNLFDAIMFLSDLSSMPIIKAAGRARGTNGRTADFAGLFFRGNDQAPRVMEFVAEMIVPTEREELRAKRSSQSDRLLEFPQSKQLPKRFIFGPGKRTAPFIERCSHGGYFSLSPRP
jgi:predicted ATPase